MVYILLADGFEEIEALAPLDFLRRGGIAVSSVSITGKPVVGAHGIQVIADKNIADVDFSDGEAIVLPGGMPGTLNLDAYPGMTDLLRSVYGRGGVLAAICAAPLILGKRGYLQEKSAVCYPGFETELRGAVLSSFPVVRDGRVLTAKSAGHAWQFGYALTEMLAGRQVSESVRRALYLPPFGE